MDNIIEKLIYQQNKIFLEKIANDNYSNDDDKNKFIQKYLKFNYCKYNAVHNNVIKIYKKEMR